MTINIIIHVKFMEYDLRIVSSDINHPLVAITDAIIANTNPPKLSANIKLCNGSLLQIGLNIDT